MQGGTARLNAHKEIVNSLNVFPVPDGDTGTNMSLTMNNAVAGLKDDMSNVGMIAQQISKGSLMGARGNSGVILSQIFRGLANGLKGKQEINVKDFSGALMHAKNAAYSAVLKPVEGTMLTVIKDIAQGVKGIHKKKVSFEEMFEKIMEIAQESLANTPNLLPALKQAGVVDSGGQGILYFFSGMQDTLLGKEVEGADELVTASQAGITLPEGQHESAQSHFNTEDIKYMYCTEFILQVDREPDKSFREKLESMGDSLVYVRDDELLKVHVHTNNPGEALERALRHGELVTIKIENMKQQHSHIVKDGGTPAHPVQKSAVKPPERTAPAKPLDPVNVSEAKKETEASKEDEKPVDCAFIAVASGSGVKTILKDIGIDYVIEGGQTMNPSTSDFVEAIEKLNAKKIVLFPNNKNIIMAANQAKDIVGNKVKVLPTQTMPECVAAVVAYDEGISVDKNMKVMKDVISKVKTINVTYSVRDTELDGYSIKGGDYIAVVGKGIGSAGKDIVDVTLEAIDKNVDEDSLLITIYTGEDADEAQTEELRQRVEEKYPAVDVVCLSGDQPVYYYIISIEE